MSGYTKIPNWILDEVMPKLSPHEFKVYLCIYRLTVGWQIESASIPFAKIVEKTGMKNHTTIRNAIAKLENMQLIEVTRIKRRALIFSIGKYTSVPNGESGKYETVPTKKAGKYETVPSGKYTSVLPIKKDKENNNRHAVWFAFFEGLTGFTPPNETTDAYQDNWIEPLEAIIKQSQGNAEIEKRITYAVMEMRKKDFTIKSIKSIKTFALNFQEKTDNGIEPAWLQVKEHVKQNKPPANGKLLTAVKAVGWPALKTMNSYTEKKLKQQFTEAYHATN